MLTYTSYEAGNAPTRGIGNNRDLSTKATSDEARSCNTRICINDKLPKSGQVRLCVHTCTVVSGSHSDKLSAGLTFIRGSRSTGRSNSVKKNSSLESLGIAYSRHDVIARVGRYYRYQCRRRKYIIIISIDVSVNRQFEKSY